MDNIQIIKQLLNGYHLSHKEIEKAKKIMELLDQELKGRLKRVINE